MRTFARAVALITVFAVITRLLGFAFRIFLSRILGAEMLGVYQIAMSFFMVFLTVIASGLPLAISKQVATKNTKGIVTAGLVISLGASLVICFFVIVFRTFLGVIFTDERCIAILIALIPSTVAHSIYSVIRAVWWGEKRFALLGATELLEQILRIVFFIIMLAFAFVFTDLIQVAALSYTFACFIAALAVIIIFVKTNKLPKDKNILRRTKAPNGLWGQIKTSEHYKPLLKSAVPITGVRAVASISMPIISVLIPMRLVAAGWTPESALAGFGTIVGMTMPLLTIPQTVISALSTALVPELSSAYKERNGESISRQVQNSLKFTLFINFLLMPFFIAAGEGIGTFLFAERMSGVYLAQFAWLMIPVSLSQITNAILNSLNAETRAMKHYLIGAVGLFTAIWFLPEYMGVGALVVGMGICMTTASLLNLLLISKLINGISADTQTKLAANIAGAPQLQLTNGNPSVTQSAMQSAFINGAAQPKFEKAAFVISVTKQCMTFAAVAVPAVLFGTFLHGILANLFIPLFFNLAASGTATVGVFLLLCHLFGVVQIKEMLIIKRNRKPA